MFHLDGEKVTRKHFCGILRKKSINVVCLNGHGADDRILGHRQETLLDTQNIELLSGTTAHVLACNTAKTLGPSAMAVGTHGYIGYDERFIMLSRPAKISQPLQDDVARLFLDAAFTAPKALLDGKSCQEAVELTQNAYRRSIQEALNSDIQSDQDRCVGFLLWNLKHLKSCR